MYYDAFSEHDAANAFLAAWRVLELVGGGGEGRKTKSEQIIDRAAWCFYEYDHMKLLGLHLMTRRDAFVHGGKTDASDDVALLYQANEFLTPLLIKYIRNYYDFDSEDEFWEFFDMPIKEEELLQKSSALRRKLYILSCANKFRKNS